jgi:hypothetical protein
MNNYLILYQWKQHHHETFTLMFDASIPAVPETFVPPSVLVMPAQAGMTG